MASRKFRLGSRWAPRFILERLYDRGKVRRDEEQGLGGFAGDDGRWVPSASPRLALGRHRRGGAQVLAGDEVVPHPILETTHTVPIEASAKEIWPWLVQMGHYRAGFYADPSWWDKYSD